MEVDRSIEDYPFAVVVGIILATIAAGAGIALLFNATDNCPPGGGAPAAITVPADGRTVTYVPKGCS